MQERTRNMRLLIDGMNLIGTRPDGWWRDRKGAMRDLVDELADYAAATGEDVTVVLDSRPFDLPESGSAGPAVVFASRSGRDAADDEIDRIVKESEDPGEWRVVTSDRGLRSRVLDHGAEVESSRTFRRRLDAG
jgi:predicted RNA-binding protein with PIN domain